MIMGRMRNPPTIRHQPLYSGECFHRAYQALPSQILLEIVEGRFKIIGDIKRFVSPAIPVPDGLPAPFR
jgi:hypothetical protein